MINEAVTAIAVVSEKDKRQRAWKYARRNKMRYIDQLLNELEMLNLADQQGLPRPLSTAVVELIGQSVSRRRRSRDRFWKRWTSCTRSRTA